MRDRNIDQLMDALGKIEDAIDNADAVTVGGLSKFLDDLAVKVRTAQRLAERVGTAL